MISSHLLALQVVVPLLSAPLCILLRHTRMAWFIAFTISFMVLAMAIMLLQEVIAHGTVSYALGGWAAPWGIEYRIDTVNAFVLLIIAVIGAVVMLFAHKSVIQEIPEHRITLFYTLYLLCLSGLLGITITGDAFNLFVFLEISSLSSYALISMGKDRRAITAAFQYLIMGTIGATFILIGIGLLYMMTGTLNMQDLARLLPQVAGTRTVLSAFAFLTVGICIKLALFPLHLWLPNAYTYAPSVISAFLAATATKVALYVLLRFLLTVFGAKFSFDAMPLEGILMFMSMAAILLGSLVAIYQDNIKRMLAYSSIAQIGYMVLGLSLASITGLTAGILHLFNHALMKGALFLALGSIMYRLGAVRLDQFRGLGKTMPWTMAAIVIAGLSLVGVPLTVGFISKWYLILAAIEQGWWPVVIVILIGSLLALVYVWRLIEAAYFQTSDENSTAIKDAPLSMLVSTWLLIFASVYFGINTELTVGVAQQAAIQLMGGHP